jgi:hypothetical protein
MPYRDGPNQLTLIEKYRWDSALYRCTCGETIVCNPHNVKAGRTRSCGCLNSAVSRGLGLANKRHGLSNSKEWLAWRAMRDRCTNANHKFYERYGGRGITVCERWTSFEAFLDDMGPCPSPELSLDRIDNDKGYEPSNCRWATRSQQLSNTRQNVWLTIRGERILLAHAAKRYGVSRQSIQDRRKRGMSDEEAVQP